MKKILDVITIIKEKFGAEPEYLWKSAPNYAVFRHDDKAGKWFAVLMEVSGRKLGLNSDEIIPILNLKCDPFLAGAMREKKGYFAAYHMNKEKWISVQIDGTVDEEELISMIAMSFELTLPKNSRKLSGGRKDWIVPSNLKMYDIIKGFEENNEHYWTQSANIQVGDTVYMYIGVPYCAIMYKCDVLEVNRRDILNAEVEGKRYMLLRLTQKYDPELMNRTVLRDYGVNAVRGPRYMPKELIEFLELEI